MSINKYVVSVKDQNYNQSGLYWNDMPSNPKIKINSPTVSMPSDWEIGRIAVTDNGDLSAGLIDYTVFYFPLYD